MKPTKAYILYHDSEESKQYANFTAYSCEQTKTPFKLCQGFYNVDPNAAWNSIGLKRKINRINENDRAQLCTAGHAALWKKIADEKDCAIILEHDAVLLYNICHVDIPDNYIISLGYKVSDPHNYDHLHAGPPQRMLGINGHEGAHAYVINHVTARAMLDEIEERGVWSAVDNMFFLLSRDTKVNLGLMDPTPAIGWIRESTIWYEASDKNYTFIESFKENYKGDAKNVDR